MSNNRQLQDTVLTTIVRSKTQVSVYLSNGIKLVGQIERFDNYAILLVSNGNWQMIYKHAISTIVPASKIPLQFHAKEKSGTQAPEAPADGSTVHKSE